ncbi:MAG: carbon monoxide dehydrogenase, partial [Solirubrobacterales bacterium]|nr:carbon monoxide dehydrogenase [Solirubrobacterales bacterium]
MATVRSLVDVKSVPGMASCWTASSGSLRIGGAVPHARLTALNGFAALAEAEGWVGNVRVRNTGTLGGNLCFGEPHGDPPTALLVHDARVRLASVRGERELSLDEFHVGVLETAREPDEVLTQVIVPELPRHGTAYLRFAAAERPSVGAAAAT